METEAYLGAIRREAAALVAAAEAAGPDAAVPSCPEWTVADLLTHVGQVQRWQAGLVARRVTEAELGFEDPPTERTQLPAWVRESTERALDAFATTPADTPMWTFLGPGTAAFWSRRLAHELAMHRVDAELAAGRAVAVDPDLARDGIDELLEIVVTGYRRDRFTGAGETVHLHCTDGDGEWLVTLDAGGPRLERAHAKGDVAARGPASDLLLVLRRRADPEAIEVFGDRALLDRFLDRARV